MRALKYLYICKLQAHILYFTKNAIYITIMKAETCDHFDIYEATHVGYSCFEVRYTMRAKYGIGNSHRVLLCYVTLQEICKVHPSAKLTCGLTLFMCQHCGQAVSMPALSLGCSRFKTTHQPFQHDTFFIVVTSVSTGKCQDNTSY